MEQSAQQQLLHESGNWLSRGRNRLLDSSLARNGGGRILEIGAGAGANLRTLARYGTVDVVEVSDEFADHLETLAWPAAVHRTPIPALRLDERFDVIVAMDVLEHIERDEEAVRWVRDRLVPGGLFIATVPAYQWLFSDHDRAIHHFRRYTRKDLVAILDPHLDVRHATYFNSALFPLAVASRVSWQAGRRLRGKSGTPQKQSSQAGRLDSGLGRILEWEADRVVSGSRAPFGLSVFTIARRPSA